MLGMLLPGFRELRVPLAAGLLWLCALWIGFGGLAMEHWRQQPLVQQGLLAGEWVGPAVVLAALGFVGYLVGVIAAALTRAAAPWRSSALDWRTSSAQLGELVSRELRSARTRGVRPSDVVEQLNYLKPEWEARRPISDRWDEAQEKLAEFPEVHKSASDVLAHEDWAWLHDRTDVIVDRILTELQLSELSLQRESKDIFEKYDRERAEAEFRDAVAWPLAASFVAVAGRTFADTGSWWCFSWLIALPLALILLRSAAGKDRQAGQFMAQAIVAGAAEAPQISLLAKLVPSPRKD
ncbi:hypothetical protein [Curtobacterium flaccumfaciens]|uniref:hypothetical protein n=1 Tax=Curtobacterium flaccumfaciens TaxID=2035 RepID=UPI003992F665